MHRLSAVASTAAGCWRYDAAHSILTCGWPSGNSAENAGGPRIVHRVRVCLMCAERPLGRGDSIEP